MNIIHVEVGEALNGLESHAVTLDFVIMSSLKNSQSTVMSHSK